MERTCVYRMFDVNKRLLYVGMTSQLDTRLAAHRYTTPWISRVVRVEQSWFLSREAAHMAETWAIANEKPIYNISNRGQGGTAEELAQFPTTAKSIASALKDQAA